MGAERLLLFACLSLAACTPTEHEQAAPINLSIEPDTIANRCSFNRIAAHPEGSIYAVWLDRKPTVLRPGGLTTSSTIGVIGDGVPPRFLSLEGEVSALNWRREGDLLEMLLNGRHYGLLDVRTGRLRVWPLAEEWTRANVKSHAWGALRRAIDDPSLAKALRADSDPASRFSSTMVLAERSTYWPSRSLVEVAVDQNGPTLFDMGYPEALSAGQDELEEYPLARPVFAPATGGRVGSQDMLSASAEDRSFNIEELAGVVKDAVFSDGTLSVLVAGPSGIHTIARRAAPKEASMRKAFEICGEDLAQSTTAPLMFRIGVRSVAALWHSSSGGRNASQLAIRFPGGPFGSLSDGFPSKTTQMVIAAGYDVLEVDGIGARRPDIALKAEKQARARVTADHLSRLTSTIVDWIDESGYSEIIVIGESFGSMAAVDLAATLSERQGNPQLVLLAPLTRLSVERSMGGHPLIKDSLQERAERLAFGTSEHRQDLVDWLEKRVALACKIPNLVVFIGSQDRRVPAERQAECIKSRQTVIERRGHADLFDDPQTWSWIN
ncbi:alpha/beta fold hydrolase [Erythrobacter rubeus]|uniref:Alpha/beta hydrolase n=1 Tax=Erythrobacter rubeus TaxID=2760803 RepID=A0ABR8KRV2_9SPHN|nr:alpha/beta hydrolase [Erythrobacter rubeus]MBD2840972.1 alpha/beta hydrolase [Erythrobacter rubeus]